MISFRWLNLLLLILPFFLCMQSMANERLIQHAISLHKAASSLYMFQLNDEDSQYSQEFLESLKEANKHFIAMQTKHLVLANKLSPTWKDILEHHGMNYEPAIVTDSYRNILRKYVIEVFNLQNRNTTPTENINQNLAQLELDILMVASYSLDVASNPYGAADIPAKMLIINPNIIAQNINKRLKELKAIPTKHNIRKAINKLANKWYFIERNVLDHQEQSAHTLVYFYITRSSQVIKKIQLELTDLE